MQSEIEEFLKNRSPKSFSASEVANVMKITRSNAQKQLKKLAAKGRVAFLNGRYVFQGEATLEAMRVQTKIDALAGRTGFPREVIDGWADGVRARKRAPDA